MTDYEMTKRYTYNVVMYVYAVMPPLSAVSLSIVSVT